MEYNAILRHFEGWYSHVRDTERQLWIDCSIAVWYINVNTVKKLHAIKI